MGRAYLAIALKPVTQHHQAKPIPPSPLDPPHTPPLNLTWGCGAVSVASWPRGGRAWLIR